MKTKTMKRVLASISAMAMCAAMAVPAMTASAANGTVTITSSQNVNVEGKSFTAYQIFALEKSGSAYKYTVTDDWYGFIADYYNKNSTNSTLTTGDEGYLDPAETDTMKRTEAKQNIAEWIGDLEVDGTDLRALALALQAEVTNAQSAFRPENGYSLTTLNDISEVDDNKVTYSIPDGYYLFVDGTTTDKAKSAPILISTNGADEATAVLKADAPSIVKKIWEDSLGTDPGTVEPNELVDANTAGIGEKVHYQINADIPDTDRYEKYTYVITDTLASGLTFDLSYDTTEEVTYGEITYKKVTGGLDVSFGTCNSDGTTACAHTVRYDAYYNENENMLKIVFDAVQMQLLGDDWGHDGKDIVVKYTATVGTGASISVQGNKNDVDLTYSNDPSSSGNGYKDDNPTEPDDPKKTTEKDKVFTYLTEVAVNKFKNALDGERLAGATFMIERLDGTSATTLYVKQKEDGSNEWYVSATENFFDNDPDAADVFKITTTADGKIVFSGLAAGKYRITEVSAPSGYNGLNGAIEFELVCKVNTTDLKDVDFDKITGTDCTWTLTITNTPNGVSQQGSDFEFNVINKTGTLFPSTGGIGTTIFYTVGIAMVLGASALYVVKRKATAK